VLTPYVTRMEVCLIYYLVGRKLHTTVPQCMLARHRDISAVVSMHMVYLYTSVEPHRQRQLPIKILSGAQAKYSTLLTSARSAKQNVDGSERSART